MMERSREIMAKVKRYAARGYTLSEIAQRTKMNASEVDLVLWRTLGIRLEPAKRDAA